MKVFSRIAAALVAAGVLAAAMPAAAQEKLTVWWVKGFYKSEDDALFEAIKKYEAKTGVKVELSQYPVQDMIPKTVAALDAGTPPDVAYADVYDFQVAGKWAFDGKLEDVSDIIVPMKDKFLKNTIETTYLYNDKTKKKAYYAFPMKQQTMHIQYWKDMLAEAGYKESDIPTTWKAYWDFWCDKVQPAHRSKTGKRTYAVGQPMGVDSSDSFYSFLTFMDAYNVKLVDDNGKLLVDDPKVKAGLDQRAARLHQHPHARVHAAVVDELEGPRQQRLLPQQDDPAHAQRDHLDRGQVARRREQRVAHRGAARDGEEELRRADRDRRLPEQARRIEVRLSRGGQDRRDLRGVEEQEAREGVRGSSCSRTRTCSRTSKARSAAGIPVTKSGTKSAFWQADPRARRCTTSSAPAR